MSLCLLILFQVQVSSLVEWYEGAFSKNDDSRIYPIKYRMKIKYPLPNISNTPESHIVKALFSYIEQPTTVIPSEPFEISGIYVKETDLFFFFYTHDPIVQIQKKSMPYYQEQMYNILSSHKNLSIASQPDIHLEFRRSFLNKTTLKHFMTYVYHRECSNTTSNTNKTCYLHGTQTDASQKIFYTYMQSYNQTKLDVDWRLFVTYYALATVLRTFTYISMPSSPPTAVCSLSIRLMYLGDIVNAIHFFILRNYFELMDKSVFSYIFYYSIVVSFLLGNSMANKSENALQLNFRSLTYLTNFQIMYCFHITAFLHHSPEFSLFLRFSYLIPQIIFTAAGNKLRTINLAFLFLMIVSQLFTQYFVLHFNPNKDFYFHNIPGLMKFLTIYVGIQYIIIALQSIFGGAFFLPSHLHLKRYSYLREKPPQNTECAVCLMNINENEPSYCTPCHHFFHQECLTRWMEEELICPLCRTPIPPLDDCIH